MSRYALGIDLGTSSVQASLLDEHGLLLASASREYRTFSPHQGWMEQDPLSWVGATEEAIKELGRSEGEALGRIGSICLTSAAHIGVLLDDRDAPLRNALLWSDQRSVSQVQSLLVDEDLIYAISANKPSTSWTLPHFLWVKEQEPEVWEQVSRVCLSKDYLLHWLTGQWVTDPATAVSAMLYDYREQAWSLQLLSYLGLKASQLPAVRPSTDVVGHLLPSIAHQLGMPPATPVVNGALDSGTETYGSGARQESDVVIRIGTAGGIHKISSEPMTNRLLLTYPFPISGLWYSQAGTNAAGSSIGWATSMHYLERNASGYDAFDALAQQAPPGSDGVLFHPFLNGERTPHWNPKLRGTYTGLSFMHDQSHMARSVLEGVSYSLREALLALMDIDELGADIVVVGGGAKNMLLMKILSSVLNTSLRLLPGVDSSTGAARMGQLAVQNPDLLTKSDAGPATVVAPENSWCSVYEEGFERYSNISKALVQIYE